jgi:hypothetical protein
MITKMIQEDEEELRKAIQGKKRESNFVLIY